MELQKLHADDNLQSTMPYGTPDFNFSYYYDVINQYQEHSIEWHWHNALEMSLVIAGPVECYVGEEHLTLQSGDALFINHGIIHRFVSHAGGVMANYIFDSEFLAPFGSRIHSRYILPILSSSVLCRHITPDSANGADLVGHLIHAETELDIQGETWEMRVKARMLEAWCCLYRILQPELKDPAGTAHRDKRSYARLREMLDYIHKHYAEDIDLDQVAAATNVSKSEALRCFKTSIQITPMAYLAEYRLNRSKELLLDGKYSVLEIALKCGFDNSSYFCKTFKKKLGLTPLEFSKRYAGKPETPVK